MRIGKGISTAVGFLVLLWAVFFAEGFVPVLSTLGINPLDVSSLWHVATAPLIHANYQHIAGNSVPGAIFAFLIGCRGRRAFWEVTTIVAVVGGAGTWLFGGIGTNHIGASGLIYGWLVYPMLRGFYNRSFGEVVLGVILAITYSGFIWGVLPNSTGVSWQYHLFGALGGAIAAASITSDDPPRRAGDRNHLTVR